MKRLDVLTATLLIVGGLNWGLVAVARFDLVATIFALDFGETSVGSRIIYGLVGLSAVYQVAQVFAARRRRTARPRAMRGLTPQSAGDASR